MKASTEGRYRGYAVNQGVSTSKNGSLQFAADYHLIEFWKDGQWVKLEEPQEASGVTYMTKAANGELLTRTVDKLKAAFGWDGADPFWLQDADLSQTLVQLTFEWETYDGKPQFRLQWLDPAEAEPPAVKRASDEERRRLLAQFGHSFRANAGGTSAKPPLPPKAAPPAAPSAPPPALQPTHPAATMEDAWAAFCQTYKGDASKRDAEWWAILTQQFGSRIIPTDIRHDEWGRLVAEMQTLVNVPF